MTNALKVPPKQEKHLTPNLVVFEHQVVQNRPPQHERASCSKSILITIYCILLLMGLSMIILRPPIHDTLSKSWLRLKENRGNFYDSQLYTPEQLHLSLGENPSEIYVTWSTMRNVSTQLVFRDANGLSRYQSEIPGQETRWTAHETDEQWVKDTKQKTRVLHTYRAKMTGLKPGRLYSYRAVSTKGSARYYSQTYYYLAKDYSNTHSSFNLALFGDLGLINGQSIPRLIKDVDEERYDVIIHNGDFAYDLNTHHGQYGDEFMRKMEPIAARVPYQTSVGNHEIAENFTHYDMRFTMINSGGLSNGRANNFYYSFNVGPIHFIAFSTEFYYFLESVGIGSLNSQYEWLIADLKHASSPSERAKRPWIIVFGHRPMYCSSRDRDDCSKDTNILRKGLPFTGSYALEKLFYDYGVDVLLWSHEHQYERFLPIYDGQIYNGTDLPNKPYYNPRAPVHIISGSAGCQERLDPFKGTPAVGSVKQISDYGFTRLKASRCELEFEQVSDDQAGTVVDNFVISKDKQTFPKTSDSAYDCSVESRVTSCPSSSWWLCSNSD